MPPIDPDQELLDTVRTAPSDSPAGMTDPVLARLGAAARAGRDDAVERDAASPPPELWARIAGELGLGAAEDDPPAATVVSLADREQSPAHRRSRWARWAPALGAAALVAAVVGATVVIADRGADTEVLREVALEPLEGGATGNARLVRLSNGQQELVLDERLQAIPADSYVEVWLIDPDSGLQRMVSLGAIEGQGTFGIPRGIDPAVYSLVDVSIEPADGVPTHSGRSVLRGSIRP